MDLLAIRARLLGGAALTLGLTMIAASPAAAQCSVSTLNNPDDTLTCTTVTTTDTSAVAVPASDRHYTFGATDPVFTNIGVGQVIDGFGLALTGDGANPLQISNDGMIRVNAGNTPSAGGSDAALFVATINTPIIYLGSGSIENRGTGAGFGALITGPGSLSASFGGGVRADNGDAIQVVSTGANGGAISINTGPGQSIHAANGDGIDVSTAGSGNIQIVSFSSITSAGFANTLQNGIIANSTGTGSVLVATGGGVIGLASDRAQQTGVTAAINNAASAGTVVVNIGNGGIASVGDGVAASTNGSGSVTVTNTGGIDATAGRGIFAGSAGGAVTVTAAAVTSTSNTAIVANQANAAGTGSITINTSGAISGTTGISAVNSGIGGVTVNTTGLVTGTAGGAIVATNTNVASNAASNGHVFVSVGAGGASATGDAVTASTVGQGQVGVSVAGAINGASGVVTSATTNSSVITVAAGGSVTGGIDGINATSTTGSITVNVHGGNVVGSDDGISLDSAGAKMVNINTGRSVTGTFGVSGHGGGTLAISNFGTLGTAGNVAVLADATTTVTVDNSSQGTINGRVALSGGNDTITNVGTWNTSGASTFGLGADLINNQTGGVVNIATGTSFDSLETFSNFGTTNATGAVTFSGVATSLTNSGTFNIAAMSSVSGLGAVTNFGTINGNGISSISNTGPFANNGTINANGPFGIFSTGSFTNSGTLNLAPIGHNITAASIASSGTIRAESGATFLTVSTTLANSGTIDLLDTQANDSLTLTGNYTGSGNATLAIDVSSTAADRLVVTGSVGGTTEVDVNLVGGVVINTEGLLVVDAGTSSANAFVLGDTFGTALIDLSLVQEGADYFLFATPNVNAFDPLALGSLTRDMWYQSGDVYGAYSAQKRSDLGSDRTNKLGLWGQLYLGRDRRGDADTQSVFGSDIEIDSRLRTERRGAQVGIDYNLGLAVLGVTGGYQHAEAELRGTAGEAHAEGYNFGGYALFGSNVGFYGGVLVKHDNSDARLTNAAFDGLGELSIKSTGIEGEAGYRFAVRGTTIDVGGGLAWVRSKIEDFDIAAIDYDFDTATSVRGRFGGRLEWGNRYGPYIDARLLHEFKGESEVTLASGDEIDTLESEGRGTWGRLELGVGAHGKAGPMASAWAEFGDVKGLGVRAGFRF